MPMYIFSSDIHGTGTKWISLMEKAKNKYPDAQVVYGGDYIDGRKESKETLDYIMNDKNAIVLRGNHEQMMLDFIGAGDDLWYYNGAKSTVKSLFGRGYSRNVAMHKLINSSYYDFISQTRMVYETKNIIFVHAGYPLEGQQYEMNDYLWVRETYWYRPNNSNDFNIFSHNTTNKTIVTGHTPTCLISGKYESNVKPPEEKHNTDCPVKVIQYPNEKPRIFTDNGCHSQMDGHYGNVVILDDNGNLIDVIN